MIERRVLKEKEKRRVKKKKKRREGAKKECAGGQGSGFSFHLKKKSHFLQSQIIVFIKVRGKKSVSSAQSVRPGTGIILIVANGY